ncbi:hypothetical protein HDV00_011064 [Rhizophlyctis rosea]|nr:hypothetical protein HDV00_011064 [Rhizophlyctis rosea]
MSYSLPSPPHHRPILTLSSLPTELKERIFALLRHPYTLAITSHTWNTLSKHHYAHILWLKNHAEWLDTTIASMTWAPRHWGVAVPSPAISGGTLKSASAKPVAVAGIAGLYQEEAVPRIIATNPDFIINFVSVRGWNLTPPTSSHIFLTAATKGQANIIRSILLLDTTPPPTTPSPRQTPPPIPYKPSHSPLPSPSSTPSPTQTSYFTLPRPPRIPSPEIEATLFRAADTGHLPTIQTLLTLRPDACRKRLHLAADLASRRGHAQVLGYLCREGEFVPGRESRSQALLMAVEGGHVECVRVLLGAGGSGQGAGLWRVWTPPPVGVTASAGGGVPATVVHQRKGATLLCLAARRGDLDMCRVLVEEGGVCDLAAVEGAVGEARRVVGGEAVVRWFEGRFPDVRGWGRG